MAFIPDTTTETNETKSRFTPDVSTPKEETKSYTAMNPPPGTEMRQFKEFAQGLSLPILGIYESIPYEPLQKGAANIIKKIQAEPEYVAPGGYGGARSLGQFITSGGIGLAPIGKGLEITKGLSLLPRVATRTLGGSAVAGGTTALTEPVADASRIVEEKQQAGKKSAIIGGILSGGGAIVGEVGKEAYKLLNRAFGGDAKKLADALKDLAAGKATKEAKLADDAINSATSRAEIAEKTALKQTQLVEDQSRQLAGTTLKEEAGKFKPIPQSDDVIGSEIKKYADNVYEGLKNTREKNAGLLKQDAFGTAFQKETQGLKVTDTQSYANLRQEIDATLRNPVTGLSNESSQLQQLKNILEPVKEVGGVVVGKPISFQSLDNIRRMLKDRSYGLPAEGFDAIGQIEAGNMAKRVEQVMIEFSDGKVKKYIEQYAKDSQPLRAFQTKLGKALIDEQLIGKGVNYSKVASEKIPGKMFADRESYQNFIDATGGNKQFAESQARKYFASQLEAIKGDAKAIEKFVEKYRTMLDLTGSKPMVEKYLADVRLAGKRAESATDIAKTERENIATQTGNKQAFNQLNLDLRSATNANEIASANDRLARRLLDNKSIDNQQYLDYIKQSNAIIAASKDKAEATKQLLVLAGKLTVGGVAGAIGYFGLKNIGD